MAAVDVDSGDPSQLISEYPPLAVLPTRRGSHVMFDVDEPMADRYDLTAFGIEFDFKCSGYIREHGHNFIQLADVLYQRDPDDWNPFPQPLLFSLTELDRTAPVKSGGSTLIQPDPASALTLATEGNRECHPIPPCTGVGEQARPRHQPRRMERPGAGSGLHVQLIDVCATGRRRSTGYWHSLWLPGNGSTGKAGMGTTGMTLSCNLPEVSGPAKHGGPELRDVTKPLGICIYKAGVNGNWPSNSSCHETPLSTFSGGVDHEPRDSV